MFSKVRPYIFIKSNSAIDRAHHATTLIGIIDAVVVHDLIIR